MSYIKICPSTKCNLIDILIGDKESIAKNLKFQFDFINHWTNDKNLKTKYCLKIKSTISLYPIVALCDQYRFCLYLA